MIEIAPQAAFCLGKPQAVCVRSGSGVVAIEPGQSEQLEALKESSYRMVVSIGQQLDILRSGTFDDGGKK
jgi:hypothetical protein